MGNRPRKYSEMSSSYSTAIIQAYTSGQKQVIEFGCLNYFFTINVHYLFKLRIYYVKTMALSLGLVVLRINVCSHMWFCWEKLLFEGNRSFYMTSDGDEESGVISE